MKGQVFVAMVAAILLFPTGPAITCDYDCYEIEYMGGVQNGTPYCYRFPDDTGRLVYSMFGGAIGGNPTSMECPGGGYTQTVEKWVNCPPQCSYAQLPQEVVPGDMTEFTLGFGCYYCSGS